MPDKKSPKEALFVTRAKKKVERQNKRMKSSEKELRLKMAGLRK